MTDAEIARLDLRFNEAGLIPAIAQAHDSGEVLMMAWMNVASLAATLREGRVVYWSRSRGELWRKGDTSGHVQHLVELRIDCDRACLLLRVTQTGPACHTGRRSCFYTVVAPDGATHEAPLPESAALDSGAGQA
jgi:phosphoribosyl-AMP cyclohydrolase